eukprot:2761134-Prymnesium_polylepis.1
MWCARSAIFRSTTSVAVTGHELLAALWNRIGVFGTGGGGGGGLGGGEGGGSGGVRGEVCWAA